MSSRSGPNSNSNSTSNPNPTPNANPNRLPRLRHARDSNEDFPPLPSATRTTLPPLRSIALGQRDREWDWDSTAPPRRQLRHSNGRRLERVDNYPPNEDLPPHLRDYVRIPEDPWTSGTRLDRIRTADARSGNNFEELDRSLEEANSHLRALLNLHDHPDLTASVMQPGTLHMSSRPQDLLDDNRRHKRRKLDGDRLAPSYRGFCYGRYGQVEPGQLRMEIVSCDGGGFTGDQAFQPEMFLKNDSQVYCTKVSRCNVILRHQASAIFTLSELDISAPTSVNFSPPTVREGLVFVSMDQDDLLTRTTQYQIQNIPLRDRKTPNEATEPPEIISVLHQDGGMTTTTRTRRSHAYRSDGDEIDPAIMAAPLPREFVSKLPDLRVTAEYIQEEDEDGLEPYSSASIRTRPSRAARNHIGALPFEHLDSDSDTFGVDPLLDAEQSWRMYNSSRRPFQQLRPSPLTEAREASAIATQEAVRAVGGELLTPIARFFLEKKKSKCILRFDPPVSGRFMLLKLWTCGEDFLANIDIRHVIAKGFAGPRFFPSVEAR